MFPPSKTDKSAGKPKPKPSPFGGGGPSAGGGPPPVDPFGMGGGPPPPPPGGDPFGPAPAGGPAMPPGMDPFGGAAQPGLGMAPGMPRPGQGMDPMQAMLNGLGPDPSMTAGAQSEIGPPMGPGGMPVGGSLPQPGDDMGGSDLLTALAGGLAGGSGGDPYSQPPGAPDTMFQGIGQGDPNMGIEQLLQMLALGQMGVGGGPGSSGLDPGGNNVGSALMF